MGDRLGDQCKCRYWAVAAQVTVTKACGAVAFDDTRVPHMPWISTPQADRVQHLPSPHVNIALASVGSPTVICLLQRLLRQVCDKRSNAHQPMSDRMTTQDKILNRYSLVRTLTASWLSSQSMRTVLLRWLHSCLLLVTAAVGFRAISLACTNANGRTVV